ncbi:hypothetical protein DFS33DRAFT_758617 [Desarmillaria ectypa]|nr:hypothetical protein DFS33DRAFT_758617 [Desarmillaria ectypa]
MESVPALHRRKSSNPDDDESILVAEQSTPPATPQRMVPSIIFPPPPPRNRVLSTPNFEPKLASAGPFRTTFNVPRTPPGTNGATLSPSRSTFSSSHARTRSISTPYSPPLPSPLSFSFPSNSLTIPTSHSAPTALTSANETSPKQSRRHSRIHSRNLSVFFPRPGSLPEATISEDGSQEVEATGDIEVPVSSIPSADPRVSMRVPLTPLGAGFTFGGRPPSSAGIQMPPLMSKSSSSTSSSRRGHHHKHSLSHNFFSFLEPGSQVRPEDLHTVPTPSPVSQWTPVSPIPTSASSTSHTHDDKDLEPSVPMGAISLTFAQFVLGAWLWVCGQQIGSLGCTGLGYWVVFDAFGLGLGSVLPGWLGNGSGKKERIRRPYGNARIETVLMFAQSVYLMFSSVYVCKETVEHVLLSMGGGDGHHHHHGDEETGFGIEFPVISILLSICSIVASAFFFNNHDKLVNVTGNRIPSLGAYIRSLSATHYVRDLPPTSPFAIILSNPYISSSLLFALCILFVSFLIPSSQHQACDLVIATLISVVTFNVSYSASVILGAVLLQTSPPRGSAGGRMEAFLRAMREVERHPQVLHLPAPHMWQLTPTSKGGTLVVTMELHVRPDLGDDEVLSLTKWTWERCTNALGGEREVTVGVVRG